VLGLLQHRRELPDRRDLNRSFPGSEGGSLAARTAWLLGHELLPRATHVVDLHTASRSRNNFPQIRAMVSDPETLRLARAFGAPLILNSTLRDGSFRQLATEQGRVALVYEGGESLRFDEMAIRVGVRGVLGVLRALQMLPGRGSRNPVEPVLAHASSWVRAPAGGILRAQARLGDVVAAEGLLGEVGDPLALMRQPVRAPHAGIVIGNRTMPLVFEGDALFHLARTDTPPATVTESIELLQEQLLETDFLG